MDDAAEIKGVGNVSAQAEMIEKEKSSIDIAVAGTELVDSPGPVGSVCDGCLPINVEFRRFLCFSVVELLSLEGAREWRTGKRSKVGYGGLEGKGLGGNFANTHFS
ncbi:hypothetical protein DM860_010275 [Cuscuta australis]|uniref:Uncharacterized protein n=1 Tax=Cuscuta australis TaxID=267555 RepID=A0A328DAZ5_9ASTE|nr:hypothetical protein DM860_010275 [Cuscuta australis]